MAETATVDLSDLGFQPATKPQTPDLTDLGFQPVRPAPVPRDPSTSSSTAPNSASAIAPPIRPIDAQVAELSANRARIQKENEQPGVPFDQDSSIPFNTRARASLEPDQARKADLVFQDPNVLSTRLTKDGTNVVVRMLGDDGKPVDRLLNPTSLTLGDIPGNAGALVKAAGTGALAFMSGSASLPVQAAIVGGGAALQNASMVSASRAAAGQSQDLAGNLADSAKEGLATAAPVLAIPAAAGVAKVLTAPFRSGGAIAGGEAAATRQGIPLSAGQRVDSGTLARLANLPGAGGGALASDQANALRVAEGNALRGAFDPTIGPPKPVLAQADIAAQTKPLLAAQADPVLKSTADEVAAATQATKDAVTNAGTAEEIAAGKTKEAELAATAKATQQKIQTQLDTGLVPSNQTSTDVSSFLRQKVQDINAARVEKFAKPYAELDAEAEKQGIKSVNTNVDALSEEVRPLMNDVISKFAPGLSKIEQTNIGMQENPLSLPALRELKNQLYFMVKSGQAPGEDSVMGSRLRDLAEAVNKDYAATIAQGTPEFQAVANKLTKDYAEQITPLRQTDVAKAFLGPEEPGFQAGHELVSRMFSGSGDLGALQGYKAVLGADSPEYKLLVRQGLKDLADPHPVTGMIDAGDFLGKLKSLHPDMRAEVLGPMEKSIFSDTELMKAAQDTKISYPEMDAALTNGTGVSVKDAGARLEAALVKQKEADQLFNSKVLRDARDGTVGPQNLSNDTYVSRLVDTADAGQAKEFMANIAAKSPELADATRQRVLKNILDDVRTETGSTPVTTGESTALDFNKLQKKYLDSGNLEKYRAFIGDKGVNFLQDIAKVNEVIARNALSERGAAQSTSNMAAHLAGEVVPGGGGVGRALVKGVTNIPGWFLGNAQRWEAARNFLATGAMPKLAGPVGQTVRAGLLSTPEAVRAAAGILAGKEAPPTPKPLAQ